ncbi:hypothetical protein BU16DRAFT_521802 [Lophium mytilinum]|uniref:DUF1772-domain-containing protein n=1 Tax=Lophium mytilinum TaxID=390894 RepID=A0A6A6REG6_9PEZI|nr:hypothetical protein BU16DRAFT_521802 [Lophium mytilinum]
MTSPGLFYHEKVPTGIIVAQTVGITSAAFLSGMNAFISVGVVPSLMRAPAGLAASQFKYQYDLGKKLGPALALLGTAASGFLAWREPRSSTAFKFWLASAIVAPSIVPWTFLTMMPTNKKLLGKAESLASTELTDKTAEAGVAKEETVNGLLDKWATLNFIRAIISGTSSVLACIAVLDRVDVVGFSEIGLATGADRLG